MELGQEAAKSATDMDSIREGVAMTHNMFMSTLEKFGIEVVNPHGDNFNPELHQAMSLQESAEAAPNSVIAVMQKGYTLAGRLLRPAMVVVSKAPEASQKQAENE
jgi:molecular chaperone GrpE